MFSSAIKDDLATVIAKPNAICIFSDVSGPGNNAMFSVRGFAGVRIMSLKLTGAMNSGHMIIQPALVVDDATITGPGPGPSYFVHHPVRLTK